MKSEARSAEELREIGKNMLLTYEKAIESCTSGDTGAAVEALTGLMEGLNFQEREIAGGLLTLYDYCITQIRSGRSEAARTILMELRDAWKQGMEHLSVGT